VHDSLKGFDQGRGARPNHVNTSDVFPDFADGYLVTDAPPNATGLPQGNLVSMRDCSVFEPRRIRVAVNDEPENGDIFLFVAPTGASSLHQGELKKYRMNDFATIYISLDELPKTRHACAVLVFVRSPMRRLPTSSHTTVTDTISSATSDMLPPPKRHNPFIERVKEFETKLHTALLRGHPCCVVTRKNRGTHLAQ
jgi:hypothetical protein